MNKTTRQIIIGLISPHQHSIVSKVKARSFINALGSRDARKLLYFISDTGTNVVICHRDSPARVEYQGSGMWLEVLSEEIGDLSQLPQF